MTTGQREKYGFDVIPRPKVTEEDFTGMKEIKGIIFWPALPQEALLALDTGFRFQI